MPKGKGYGRKGPAGSGAAPKTRKAKSKSSAYASGKGMRKSYGKKTSSASKAKKGKMRY